MNKDEKRRARILEIAEHHEFRVHIYSWTGTDIRRIARRLAKEGKLELVRREHAHFIYRKPK